MTDTILGLDIGGANVKAASADGRAWNEPFALWKDPDGLGAVLVELLTRFPDAHSLTVTMTGELCDCYQTKREGVNRILDAVQLAARDRSIRVWGTDGRFHSVESARANHLTVAASNWHALATYCGRHVPTHAGMLLDIGSTTTDVIPLEQGVPATIGATDYERLASRELVYTGVRRTPLCNLVEDRGAAEFFATTHDVYLVLGLIPEDSFDNDTADHRPATVENAFSRLARMLGGDRETHRDELLIEFAIHLHRRQLTRIVHAFREVRDRLNDELKTVIVSGSGEFLARRVIATALPDFPSERIISLTADLGERLSTCAPAYALAVLGHEASVQASR